jgi:tetratricopeptide (TPR) repeat protein
MNHEDRDMRGPEKDPGYDPIWSFLQEELKDPDRLLGRRELKRGWRPDPYRIAGLATAVVLIVASVGLVTSLGTRPGDSTVVLPGIRITAGDGSAAQSTTLRARVDLLEGMTVVVRSGRKVILQHGDEVLRGDALENTPGSSVGIAYPGGLALVLDGEGRIEIREADPGGVHVRLSQGVLAARVPPRPASETRTTLRVEGENAELRVKGTVFTVRADRGRLTDAAVASGEVEVKRKEARATFRLGRQSKLDMRKWVVEAGTPDTSALGRLARITGGVEVQAATAAPEETDASAPRPPTVIERIQKALKAGNVEEAVKLVEKHGKGQKGASFNLLAGEAYRRAGRWSQAADAYLAGAKASEGKKAEKAMLRAADIQLRKLKKPIQAAKIIESYLARFPSGSHLDEGLYLGGVAHSKCGSYKRARGLFEKYLSKFPGRGQALQVHLALAKIKAVKMGDCAGASKHIKAVQSKAAGSVMAKEADKIAARCSGQNN